MEHELPAPNKPSSPLFKHTLMNPIVRKLDKVTERDEAHSATYSGIVRKTLFFLLLTGAGVALYFWVHQIFMPDAFFEYYDTSFSLQEIGVTGIALLVTVLSPILIWAVRPLVPVFGSLYCLGQGFLVAWMGNTLGGEYRMYVWLSLALTLVLVAVMLVLYVTGVIKVTAKFRSVVTTLFLSSVLFGIVIGLCGFVPFLRPFAGFFTDNLVVNIAASVIFIIVAALFLLVDFDCIKHTVEDKLPKKYEWFASMALVFTIIWLYFKILNLLLKLTSAGKQNT